MVAVCEISQPSPAVPGPNATLANDVFPKLVSRKETFPVGDAGPPIPSTVAVSEYAPGDPLEVIVVVSEYTGFGAGPTVNARAADELVKP
jgi:hypothetical protein